MYDLWLTGVKNTYEYEELVKVFLSPSEYRLSVGEGPEREKKEAMRELYRELSSLTGRKPEWGTLTGVRPVKLAGELYERVKDKEKVKKILEEEYLVDPVKSGLLVSVYMYQREVLKEPEEKTVGIYIGIPFCPTRCLYCSFTSNQASAVKIAGYMEALLLEIEFTGREMEKAGMRPETVFVGGGTPTALPADELLNLLCSINNSFDMAGVKEFTVEAGRPDTITPKKLKIMKSAGVTRVCVNPQSMLEKTLALIGRSHTPEDIREAFRAVRREGFGAVNMDVIAGLPEESEEDFMETVREAAALGPENITVHTLAVKRASKLIDVDRDYHYGQAGRVGAMLSSCNRALAEKGYIPYYLYRQKHMAGNFENVGWCKDGAAGIYNIRIMQEAQTVIALGAGGITKVYYPDENKLIRIPNVANYELYISRIDEMIDRKKEKLFSGGRSNADKRA